MKTPWEIGKPCDRCGIPITTKDAVHLRVILRNDGKVLRFVWHQACWEATQDEA